MKGKRLLGLCLAALFVLGALAGCAVDPDEAVAMVGDVPVYRWRYDAYLNNQLALRQKYSDEDLTSQSMKTEFERFKEFRLNELLGDASMMNEAVKMGLDQLTAEEEAEVDAMYMEYYNQTMAGYLAEYGADEQGRAQAEKAYLDLLAQNSLNPERMRKSYRDAYIMKKFVLAVNEDLTPSDELLQEYYNSTLQQTQDECTKDPLWFGENYSAPLIYAPEGYIDTVRITLNFTDEQRTELTRVATAANTAQQAYLEAVQIHGETSRQAQKLIPDLDSTEEAFRKSLESCYQALEEEIEKIRAEALAGADFIQLMEQRSNDTHLISYFVTEGSTHVPEAYLQAALALKNDGDISEPLRLDQGVCIIQRVEEVPAGARPFEEVKDELRTRMINSTMLNVSTNMQTEYYEKAQAEGTIQIYKSKLK